MMWAQITMFVIQCITILGLSLGLTAAKTQKEFRSLILLILGTLIGFTLILLGGGYSHIF